MYNYLSKPGQNLVDIAMQHYGSAEAVVELCIDNNLNIGQDITAGLSLLINEENIINKRLVTYYKNNNLTVASE
ncbi:MAG: hypothetical protein JXA16_01060 [Bacteroidales bacterium]|nr:hypothetical protein [Bacteroidales bacterium]